MAEWWSSCQSQIIRNEWDWRTEKDRRFVLLASPLLCIYFSCLPCFTHVWRAIYFQWHKMTIIHLQGAKGTVDRYQWLNDLEAKTEAESVRSINISASSLVRNATQIQCTNPNSQPQRDRTFPRPLTYLICSKEFKVTREQRSGRFRSKKGEGISNENTNEDLICFAFGEIHSRDMLALYWST